MQWNNNVYRYQPQSLLYVAFFFLVLFSLLIKAGVGFFKLHKHARIFFKWKLLSCYSTRALQFTKQQDHLSGSQHEGLRANEEDSCLDPVSKF